MTPLTTSVVKKLVIIVEDLIDATARREADDEVLGLLSDMFQSEAPVRAAVKRFVQLCVVELTRGIVARRWIPVYLEHVIGSTRRFSAFDRLLEQLHGDTFGDEKAWEAVVVLALYARLLLSSKKRGSRHSPEFLPIGLPDDSGFDFSYQRARAQEVTRVDLLYPTYASFPLYDVIVVVRAPKKRHVVQGPGRE